MSYGSDLPVHSHAVLMPHEKIVELTKQRDEARRELAGSQERTASWQNSSGAMLIRAEKAEADLAAAQKQIAMDTVRFMEMQDAGHRMEAELAAARSALHSACTRAQSALVCTIEHDQFRLLESLCDELVIATSAAKEAP
jgi:hypothetical protein